MDGKPSTGSLGSELEVEDRGMQIERDPHGNAFPAFVSIVKFTCDRCGEQLTGKNALERRLLVMLATGPSLANFRRGADTDLGEAMARAHRATWWKRLRCWVRGLV